MTTHHVLTITSVTAESKEPVLQMQIPAVDPMLAVPAILNAISQLPKPMGQVRRKKRKDAGTHRNITTLSASPDLA